MYRQNVITPETKAVMDTALARRNQRLSDWPGKYFDMGTMEGVALLGTAHGVGIARFLADHRQSIPKRVKGVYVFSSHMAYNLLYTFAPLEGK